MSRLSRRRFLSALGRGLARLAQGRGAAFLMGGRVAGGGVVADWPGLKPRALYAGRGLAPTADLRTLFRAALGDHLGLAPAILEAQVLPG